MSHSNDALSEDEPRYVSHPTAAHVTGVVWHNEESNTDTDQVHVIRGHASNFTAGHEDNASGSLSSKRHIMKVAVASLVVVALLTVCVALGLVFGRKQAKAGGVSNTDTHQLLTRDDTVLALNTTTSAAFSTAPHISQELSKSHVNSVKHISNFTLTSNIGRPVSILSVSSKGQLLVGQRLDRQLHVYSADCRYLTSITLPYIHLVIDAVWTRQGNIVYISMLDGGIVVTISQTGDVIQQLNALQPRSLSVSTDAVICLSSDYASVYQSTNDGWTWSCMFIVSDGWQCLQVIKVSTDGITDVLWTVVQLNYDYRLRVYTVDKRRAVGDNVIWRYVALPNHVTVGLYYGRLAYDGHTSIFVTNFNNRAVQVWSLSGQYMCQMLVVSRQQLSPSIHCVAVDTQRYVMYVGQDYATVGVLQLTYVPL